MDVLVAPQLHFCRSYPRVCLPAVQCRPPGGLRLVKVDLDNSGYEALFRAVDTDNSKRLSREEMLRSASELVYHCLACRLRKASTWLGRNKIVMSCCARRLLYPDREIKALTDQKGNIVEERIAAQRLKTQAQQVSQLDEFAKLQTVQEQQGGGQNNHREG